MQGPQGFVPGGFAVCGQVVGWGDVGAGGAPLHRFAVPLALSGEA